MERWCEKCQGNRAFSQSSQKPARADLRSSLNTRRSFLNAAAASSFAALLPRSAWGQQPAKEPPHHPSSAHVVDRLKTRLSFQISVDVGTLDLGLNVATAAVAGGVDIIEMGTPLLKTQGVANVVPAFRKRFPSALLLADMKTMDGGGGEARSVFAGGGNIVDFLALAGVDTAKSICAVRDEFRRAAGSELPRLVFSDILVPHQGPARQAGEVALRMVEAGVDAVGIHLQSDARRANPKLIEDDYLSEVARAVFERVGKAVPVQVVGGLTIPQARSLAKVGLRAFVISGNMGLADSNARYNLPPAEIQRLVAGFIAGVSAGVA
jgi:3-keto-L-gulonate-6-phosphate decarboxylase